MWLARPGEMIQYIIPLIPCGILAFVWALNIVWAVPLALVLSVGWKKRLSLQGRTVLITGGSSGIGLAVAKLAAFRGAHVIIVARDAVKLEEARAAIDANAPGANAQRCKAFSIDLTLGAEAVEKKLLSISAVADGLVDVAILSAGDSVPKAFEDIEAVDFERLMNLNVGGCVKVSRTVLPGMKRRRSGRLVFISSMAGQLGVYGFTAYSASKFALRGFAEALRMEARPWGVGVTLVHPPDVETPLLERENVNKPIECRRISEGSGLWQADLVARKTLDGVAAGHMAVGYGVDGWMLSHLTAGMLPPNTAAELVCGLFTWPLFRLIGLGHVAYFDGICRNEARRKPAWKEAEASDVLLAAADVQSQTNQAPGTNCFHGFCGDDCGDCSD